MGKHIICGPLIVIWGGMQVSWCQTGGKRGDARRRFCKYGQNLLNGERSTVWHVTSSFRIRFIFRLCLGPQLRLVGEDHDTGTGCL